MLIYVLNRNEELLTALHNDTELCGVLDFNITEDLVETNTLEFSVSGDTDGIEFLTKGNYVVTQNMAGVWKMFVIQTIRDSHGDVITKSVYAEDYTIELGDLPIGIDIPLGEVDIYSTIPAILEGTGIVVDKVDVPFIKPEVTEDLSRSNKLAVVNYLAGSCGMVVLTSVDVSQMPNAPLVKKIKVVEFNKSEGKRFEFDGNLTSIEREEDNTTIKTAVIPLGKALDQTEEDKEAGKPIEYITIKDVVWSVADGDMLDKPAGQDILINSEATAINGIKDANGIFQPKVVVVHFNEIEDPEELALKAYWELEKLIKPRTSFTFTANDIVSDEDDGNNPIEIGDQCYVIDNSVNPPIIEEVIVRHLSGNPDSKESMAIEIGTPQATLVDEDLSTQITNTIKNNGLMSGSFTDLSAINAEIKNLKADKASIKDLEAITIRTETIEAEVGVINTLVSGNITSDNIHSSGITSDKLVISNGFIKDAMIDTLSAGKLLAGTIDTGKITIGSKDGGITIADNTQQFKDKNGKVRIQMGQDAKGEFSFGLFDETGTGTLIDSTGVKEGALGANIIKSHMVSENAIGDKQIDYTRFTTGFNADTNTNTLKSSKVRLDGTNQTLDVAFNTMTSTINNIQVGGRNYWKHSNVLDIVDNADLLTKWYSTRGTIRKSIATEPMGIYLVMPPAQTGNSFMALYTLRDRTMVFPKGTEVTLSMFVVVGQNCKGFTINAFDQDTGETTGATLIATSAVNVTKNELRVTFKMPYNNTNFYIYNNGVKDSAGADSNLVINKVKLELGNKATDWTPAVEEVQEKITANSTEIKVQQGKIETAISNTVIEKDGFQLLLKDEFSNLEQTVDGITTTVGNHTSSLTDLGKKVESNTSSIKQNADKIALKVESSDITEAINGIVVGGTNLYRQTKAYAGDAWNWNAGPVTIAESYKGFTVINTRHQWGRRWQKVPVDKNTEYTMSAWVKSGPAETAQTRMTAYVSDGETITAVSGYEQGKIISREWTRVSCVFRTSSMAIETKARFEPHTLESATNTPDFFVCGLKLEKGNKATDWTEAPEDVLQTVDSKITTATSQIITDLAGVTLSTSKTEKEQTSIKQGIRCNNVGMLRDYSGYTTPNAGELYLHGYWESTGEMGDTDGHIMWNGKKQVVKRGMINPNTFFGVTQTVYLCLSGDLSGNTIGIVWSAGHNSWRYVGLIGFAEGAVTGNVNINTTPNICIGQFKMKEGGEEFDHCYLYSNPIRVQDAVTIETYETRMNSAEIAIKPDSIVNTVMASKTNGKDTFAQTSTVEQLVNQVKFDFSSSGGSNLLKNTKATNGTAYWYANGGSTIAVSADGQLGSCFATKAPSGIFGDWVKLKNDTNYIYEGLIYTRQPIVGNSAIPMHFWCHTAQDAGTGQATIVSYKQSVPNINKWTKCYVQFKTKPTGDVWFRPFVYLGGTAVFDLWAGELSLTEGIVESPWTPHAGEVYSGNTVIDAGGVTINNGALKINNNANQEVLKGDAQGNLVLNGGNMSIIGQRGGTTDSVRFTQGGILISNEWQDGEAWRDNRVALNLISSKFSNELQIKADVVSMIGTSDARCTLSVGKGNITDLDASYINCPDIRGTDIRGKEFHSEGWFRAKKENGLYFTDYGGGFHMQDSYWVRVYNGKALLCDDMIKGNTFASNNDFMHEGHNKFRWLHHSGAGGNNFQLVRSSSWNNGDWNWGTSFTFNPNVGGSNPGIQFGQAGPWVKGMTNGSQALEVRNMHDSDFGSVLALQFLASSKRERKENIKDIDSDINFIDVLMDNKIQQYNYKSDMMGYEELDRQAGEKGYVLDHVKVAPTTKFGLILEDLTDDIKNVLSPVDADGIDIYAMTSTLWKICQEQQKTINEQSERLAKIEKALGL